VPADLVAVHTGQVPVQHHDVIAGHGQLAERFGAVVDGIDRHAFSPQPGHDRPRRGLEIFHN
jgi:hypothetical protein